MKHSNLSSGIRCVALGVTLGLLVPSVAMRVEAEMTKIDVSWYVQGMERALRARQDPMSREKTITVLRRWQFDTMLDDASRVKARLLVREFESTGGMQAPLGCPDSRDPGSESPKPLEPLL